MTKREGELKSAFGRELRQRAPGFMVLQYATNGAPDRSIVGCGRQTNWEMKHGTPAFDSPGDQELECCRLAVCGHCRYVVFWECKGMQKTLIVHPRKVIDRSSWNLDAESWCMGHDVKWLVGQVLKEHGQ